jgi:putative peptide zinc metalloprotease protein
VAVIIAKTFHELGHAYMCKKHSLGVPAMGVAFLVLFPMLYTDTNESWKVKNPKQRITISLAGVMMEFYVAIFAMWLWMILPNGGFKSACFFLCTYSLIATIIINISPFLRFDGYHVLSDILSMRNLQTRSFALLKWRIRNLFFGLNIDPPECFNLAKRRFLYVYAALTWIYRFVLFIGIAFLIYYFFFKALGIILFCVEIYYFILRPIFNEVKIWWGFRDQIKINKNTICLLVMLFFLIIFLVIPWQNSISLPSTISYQKQEVFTDSAAKVSDILVKNGDIVVKDQVLLKLASPKLEFNINIVKNKI